MATISKSLDEKFIKRVAKRNGVPPEVVVKYLHDLSSGRKVIYHLDLSNW